MQLIESLKVKKEFKPFSFTIKVEDVDDLKNLWHRFNAAKVPTGRKGYFSIPYPKNWDNGKHEIWEFLDNEVQKIKIK